MKKILACVILCVFLLGQEEQKATQEENALFQEAPKDTPFSPAKVKTPYYASFNVSWVYANFSAPAFHSQSFESINFGVDTGWILKQDKLLVGIFLDGAVGIQSSSSLYGLFTGVKVGGRVFGGRMIPYIKAGMSLVHLPFELNNKQFNAYGGVVEIGSAFDIGKGYGINLAYRYNYGKPYNISLSKLQTSIVTLGISFYDFGITW